MSTCKSLTRICLPARQSYLLPRVQSRHESTTRRHRKLLTLPEAPSFTPSQSQPSLIFNPPSSAPSVYHTPLKFLPKQDKRKQLYTSFLAASTQSAHRLATPHVAQPGTPLFTTNPSPASASSTASHLPPRPSAALPSPVRTPYDKSYHLGETEIREIQKLRREDPDKWTRARLAEKFECSQFFVGMVAKNGGKAEKVDEEHARSRARWGGRRREARVGRERRKDLWGRDA